MGIDLERFERVLLERAVSRRASADEFGQPYDAGKASAYEAVLVLLHSCTDELYGKTYAQQEASSPSFALEGGSKR
jgi:hypothetical protein